MNPPLTLQPCPLPPLFPRTLTTLMNRIIEPELILRIPALLQLPQLLQPPRLIPIHGLQTLIAVRIVDVCRIRSAVGDSRLYERARLTAPFFGFVLEVGTGGPFGKETAAEERISFLFNRVV